MKRLVMMLVAALIAVSLAGCSIDIGSIAREHDKKGKTRAIAEAQFADLQRGDLILRRDGKMLYVVMNDGKICCSPYPGCLSYYAYVPELLSTQAVLVIKKGSGGYDEAALRFVKQMPEDFQKVR